MESEADRGISAATSEFILEYDALCRKYAMMIMPLDDTVSLVVRASLDATIVGRVEELRKANAEIRGGVTSAEADCSAIEEMGLCEIAHVYLRPNQLYRFVVMPACDKCKALDVYNTERRA